MHKIKLKKFSCRYQYLGLGRKTATSSASWIPYGHPLLETPPGDEPAVSMVAAAVQNQESDHPYAGLVLRQSLETPSQLGAAIGTGQESEPLRFWRWGLIEPRDYIQRSVLHPISPATRRIVSQGITKAKFSTRQEALRALQGVLLHLEAEDAA